MTASNDPFAAFPATAAGTSGADLTALDGLDLSQVEVAEEFSFRAPEPGFHNAVVTKTECRLSSKGLPMAVLTYAIDDANDTDHGVVVLGYTVLYFKRTEQGRTTRVLNPGFRRMLEAVDLWREDPRERVPMLNAAGLKTTVDRLFALMLRRKCTIKTSVAAPRQRVDRETGQPMFNPDGSPLMGSPRGQVDEVEYEPVDSSTTPF